MTAAVDAATQAIFVVVGDDAEAVAARLSQSRAVATRDDLAVGVRSGKRVSIALPGWFASVAASGDEDSGERDPNERDSSERDSSKRDSGESDTGISVRDGVAIAFEGYMVGCAQRGAALREALIADFLRKGEDFLRDWIGSYRMALYRDGVAWFYSDHVGSRPWFHIAFGGARVWSSSALPLTQAATRLTLDGANLLQFLAAGRFFAGGSPYLEIRQAGPGECHRIGDGHARIRSWYRYALASRPCDIEVALETLKGLCDEAVSRHFRRARRPSLMLSGGYDSRYLLNTVDTMYGPAHGVRAWLWCERDDDPGSDLSWARSEARRLGVAFDFFEIQARVGERFAAMFDAQSGMTEQIFTHSDERLGCERMAHVHGCSTLLRADECFGPDGGAMTSREQALAKVGVPGVALETAADWFDRPISDWHAAREEQRAELARAAQTPDDLRDVLYCRERLPALHAHLHTHRRPWLETHNPLLDPPILAFVAGLEPALRTDKRLFRACFHRYFPTAGFATRPGGFGWWRFSRPDSPQAAFLLAQLRTLPEPLDRRWFVDLATRAIARMAAGAHTGTAPVDADAMASLKLAARALILGHWLRRWPPS